jgi:hypothetical protein
LEELDLCRDSWLATDLEGLQPIIEYLRSMASEKQVTDLFTRAALTHLDQIMAAKRSPGGSDSQRPSGFDDDRAVLETVLPLYAHPSTGPRASSHGHGNDKSDVKAHGENHDQASTHEAAIAVAIAVAQPEEPSDDIDDTTALGASTPSAGLTETTFPTLGSNQDHQPPNDVHTMSTEPENYPAEDDAAGTHIPWSPVNVERAFQLVAFQTRPPARSTRKYFRDQTALSQELTWICDSVTRPSAVDIIDLPEVARAGEGGYPDQWNIDATLATDTYKQLKKDWENGSI